MLRYWPRRVERDIAMAIRAMKLSILICRLENRCLECIGAVGAEIHRTLGSIQGRWIDEYDTATGSFCALVLGKLRSGVFQASMLIFKRAFFVKQRLLFLSEQIDLAEGRGGDGRETEHLLLEVMAQSLSLSGVSGVDSGAEKRAHCRCSVQETKERCRFHGNSPQSGVDGCGAHDSTAGEDLHQLGKTGGNGR